MLEVQTLTGARPSELRALKAGDFNLDKNEVTISSAWTTDKKTWALGPTQTGVERALPLHESLLLRLKAKLGRLSDSHFLFTPADGRLISDEYYRKHIVGKAAKAAGAPWATPYTFCHTFASIMIGRVGAPIGYLSYLIGHAYPIETLDTYVHFYPADGPSWVYKMEAVSAPISEQNRHERRRSENIAQDSATPYEASKIQSSFE